MKIEEEVIVNCKVVPDKMGTLKQIYGLMTYADISIEELSLYLSTDASKMVKNKLVPWLEGNKGIEEARANFEAHQQEVTERINKGVRKTNGGVI